MIIMRNKNMAHVITKRITMMCFSQGTGYFYWGPYKARLQDYLLESPT